MKQIAELENSKDDDSLEQLEILKTELFDIRNDKLKGHMIRSKAQCTIKAKNPQIFLWIRKT